MGEPIAEAVRLAVKRDRDGRERDIRVPALHRAAVWAVTPAIDVDGLVLHGLYVVTHARLGLKAIDEPYADLDAVKALCDQLGAAAPNAYPRATFGDLPSPSGKTYERCRAVVGAWRVKHPRA